jgi:hypothetical protein
VGSTVMAAAATRPCRNLGKNRDFMRVLRAGFAGF